MLGWLIINSFVHTTKFNEIYQHLHQAALSCDMDLEIKTSDSLLNIMNDDFGKQIFPDFVIFWDKDIYLAKLLEQCNVRLFNKASAIEICDNKILTYLCLNNNVKFPKTIIAPKTFEGVGYYKKDFLKSAIAKLGLPLIIKEAYGSFGKQVYLAHSYEECSSIIDSLGYKDFLMQEFISSSKGKDIRINIVGNKVISAMERYNENDFRSNISNGGKMKPISISKEQEEIALKVCQLIGLDFAGVDIMFGDNNTPILCEVNSNPHFISSLQCTGVDMSIEIMKYIKECLEK